jgi:hypothetical protein
MTLTAQRLVFGIAVLLAAITLMASERAIAGPPFVTDDPEPVDYHHWGGLRLFGWDTRIRGYERAGSKPRSQLRRAAQFATPRYRRAVF